MSKRFAFLALLSGCAGAQSEPTEPEESGPEVREDQSSVREQSVAITPAPTTEPVAKAARHPGTTRYHEELVASAARMYKHLQIADDELHWAPGLCRLPAPGSQHLSAANGAAHDGKVFVLWTSDINRYGRAVGWLESDWPDPPLRKLVGSPPGMLQILVKESFVPREFHPGDDPGPYADLHGTSKDGKPIVPGDPMGLFVMIELVGKPEGTDEGWIYGTVTPDGKVTAASDEGACHDCHSTRENRLFGLGTRPG